jgi:hypothetical protein
MARRLVGCDINDDPDNYRVFVYDPVNNVTTDQGGFGPNYQFQGMNADTAVGWAQVGDTYTGFLLPLGGGPRTDLNTRFGWPESYVYGINQAGWVIGEYCASGCGTPDDQWVAFAWDHDVSVGPVPLPQRADTYARPVALNETWIVAVEDPPSNAAVAYTLEDLAAAPTLVGEMKGPRLISDAGVVVGGYSHPLHAYDLAAASPQTIELGTIGGMSQTPAAVAEVGGHTIVVGGDVTPDGSYHAVAWVLGVPDGPTIALVADSDGIVPVDGVTADPTPTLAGTTEPAGHVVIHRAGTEIGAVTADATTGAWSYTSTGLADGTYTFTATLEPAAGWPSGSSPATVTVTTTPTGPKEVIEELREAVIALDLPATVKGGRDLEKSCSRSSTRRSSCSTGEGKRPPSTS